MKYLDNLIAWGDSLFRQDTIETLNEATQIYVLAANLLGPQAPARSRRATARSRKTYAQLKAGGHRRVRQRPGRAREPVPVQLVDLGER